MKIGQYENEHPTCFTFSGGGAWRGDLNSLRGLNFHLKTDEQGERDRISDLGRHLLAALHLAKPCNK
jgi:hypothetical protein